MEKIEETFELEFIDIQKMREIKSGTGTCMCNSGKFSYAGGCLWNNKR